MVISPQLFTAKVMHKRLLPKINTFSYGVYYLALPLPASPIVGFFNQFYAQDLGYRDGRDPLEWIQAILTDYGLHEYSKHILLITMPRVLGYVFNPVSFYLCLDEQHNLRAVLCEVHNTFGEQHHYLCAHPDHRPIQSSHWLEADKVFHVSPFLNRNGSYKFRFDFKQDTLGIWIDYYNEQTQKQLITSLVGQFTPLTPHNLNRAFWRHPLVSLKAITLIHWQALKLIVKGIGLITQPKRFSHNISATRNLTKM